MRATQFLEQQHRDAEELLKRVVSGNCDVAQAMDELGTHLMTHMMIEQVVLIPEVLGPESTCACRALDEQVLERLELRRILSTDASDADLKATMVALADIVEHHIKEAEQELLPKAEAVLPAEMNERLGERMEKLFDVLVARSHRSESVRFTLGDDFHRRTTSRSSPAEPDSSRFGSFLRR
jgi:hypothetical protein